MAKNVNTVVQDAETGTVGGFAVKRVSASKLPGTKHRGRKRQPTEFDAYMEILPLNEDGNTDDNWLGVDYQDADHLKSLLNELTKASNFYGVGISKQVDEINRVLYFLVKERATRTAKDEQGAQMDSTDESNAA